MSKAVTYTIDNIPNQLQDYSIVYYLQQNSFSKAHMQLLKVTTQLKDYVLAKILHVTPKTFAKYLAQQNTVKKDTQEHIIMLTALYKHGAKVFECTQNFNTWLNTPNLFLDNQKPFVFLDTISGIRFLDDRLVAITYGDHV